MTIKLPHGSGAATGGRLSMRQISTEQLTRLIGVREPPCISLYQPTHRRHPEDRQDPIRYRNLLVELETSLREKYPTRQVRPLMESFQSLARDDRFWNHRTDGLAIFSSPATFELYEFQRPIRELLIVADSFHTKPLMRILQSADRYQVLCLNRSEARLYEGNRDALDPVELTDFPSTITAALGDQLTEPSHMIGSYGESAAKGGTAVHHDHGSTRDEIELDMFRFFRSIDRGILEHHSRPSGLPLMLAALPEYHEPFRRVSHNPNLMGDGIMLNPDALALDELRQRAWERIEPQYVARLERLKENFNSARTRHAGTGDLSDVAKASVAGKVGTLLVEADRIIPGVVDRSTGAIRPVDAASDHVDDMLDDLCELVLATGGEVVVVPRERMPTDSGLAAIYRF
jgi:hypothetical protein